ncbi:FMN-dependent dehydrogenase [Metarhizium robertsii]|uniref:Alpha-hydroxy acid dehydrogenase, FMN-dependent n=2 Tax=Metarhizium robertsii TaxID=568076 RepID=E9EW26_METRA|nr:Alpha-hydroxy acid dehydrogenase, FMN-dependent [Metarhizium robertsii ARSEF 23]EFZ00448.1 Alpha-hydroxy acid dehydrogenase, FMN-dependent [Metarhizium robertsii ARSEF 23]EXV02927.1 FMN-dependent dehydrogenase [Metarhizium robertsii]
MSGSDDDERVPCAQYLRSILEKGLLLGSPPVVTTNPNSLEEQAKKVMPKKGWDYIKGGAGESSTMDADRLAFRQWKIVPRVLTPTTPRDLSTTLFGEKYDTPVLMAPIGVQSWYHDDKEVGTATACANLRVPFTLSTAASTNIEELVEKVPRGPKWFQLYWPLDEEITASILTRAKVSGFKVLVVTLDTWTLAWRPYDLDPASVPFIVGEGDDVGFNDPVFRQKFAQRTDGETPEESKVQAGMYWCSEVFPGVSRSWEDLKILRRYWDGPIVLKGILSVEDARLAVEHGMDGLIVSTHGGRQLDGAVGTLDVLPDIADAVGDKITVMIDSGIRTGADILKAVALGAKGVFLGRPVVYGLGIDGAAGAEAVIAGILADFDLTMGFCGAKTIADIKRSLLKKVSYPGDVKANL